MKKLARSFCFSALAAMSVASLFLAGCSTPPPQAVPGPAQSVQPQQPGQPGQPAQQNQQGGTTASAPAAPTGEVSLARNFYFVFDGSGSMDGQRLRDAKQAVKEFLKNVPDDVNIGLYVFDYYGDREVLPLKANNKAQFVAQVDKVYAGGGTPLGAAIAKGASTLAAQREKQLQYGEYRLIVITDGEASDYIETGTDAAEKNLVPIYTIGFQIGNRHKLRQHSVSYQSANDINELRKALTEAAAELDVFDPQSFQKK
jgi:secreted protein with Ig-like and vWFA domain